MLSAGPPVLCEKPSHAGTSQPPRPRLLCTESEDSSFPPAFLSLCWLRTRLNHLGTVKHTADVGCPCRNRMSSSLISFHYLQAATSSF